MIPDNEDTKEGVITKAITAINGTNDQTFAFVYPILKNNGICMPVITENAKNDRPNPRIISSNSNTLF